MVPESSEAIILNFRKILENIYDLFNAPFYGKIREGLVAKRYWRHFRILHAIFASVITCESKYRDLRSWENTYKRCLDGFWAIWVSIIGVAAWRYVSSANYRGYKWHVLDRNARFSIPKKSAMVL